MKVLILNGSPRRGNTVTAIDAFAKSIPADAEVKIIDTDDLCIEPCKACLACGRNSECIYEDDGLEVMADVAAADVIVFASPVYWWGISAQLKIVIDKFYSNVVGLQASNKKIGLIMVGGAAVGSVQYDLIEKQFECIAEYLNWDMRFSKTISARETDDLQKQAETLAEIEKLWDKIK